MFVVIEKLAITIKRMSFPSATVILDLFSLQDSQLAFATAGRREWWFYRKFPNWAATLIGSGWSEPYPEHLPQRYDLELEPKLARALTFEPDKNLLRTKTTKILGWKFPIGEIFFLEIFRRYLKLELFLARPLVFFVHCYPRLVNIHWNVLAPSWAI